MPLSSLIYYNYKIYKAMKSSNDVVSHDVAQRGRYKQEKSLATVMIRIVVVFMICHGLRKVLFFYILVTLQTVQNCNKTGNVTFLGPLWLYMLFSINNLLLVINSSVNMVIYCCINSKFRKHLIAIILPFSSRLSNGTSRSLSRREAD